MQRHDGIVDLTPADKELTRQNLSTLLACLRIRFDAIQASQSELVVQQDIEHLEICKRISHYCDPDTQQTVYNICTLLQEALIKGHNTVKLQGYGVKEETAQNAISNISSNVRNVLMSIPQLQSDAE